MGISTQGSATAARRRSRWSAGHLFVLPALAIVCVFVLAPIGRTLYLSLFSDIRPGHFVGLDNYRRLLADPRFWRAVRNTLFLAGGSLAVQMPLALGLAVFATRAFRGRSLARAGFFLPVLMPTSAVALIWLFMTSPPSDVVNRLFEAAGLSALRYPWLYGTGPAAEWIAMTTLLLVVSWKFTGFHMMLYMAGIESIPEEIYEAARLDGASSWGSFWHITLPLLRRVIAISFTLSLIGSLKYFDIIWVMTGGDGPFSGATDLMATYMYRTAYGAGAEHHLAAASAVGILVLCLAVFGLTRLAALAGGRR